MEELTIYKNNKIKILIDEYNKTIFILQTNLNVNIKKINSSFTRNKQILINNLIMNFNASVNVAKNKLKSEIDKVNRFTSEFTISNYNKKKALLVGINYLNTPYQLNGCIKDTERIKEVLVKKGFNSFTTITDISDIKPTKKNILNEFIKMLTTSSAGDVLFFYFSGHGSYTYDNNRDEVDGKDEMIVSSDLLGILDDEFKSILSTHLKKDVTLIGLFDSCHSGTMFDLKYNYLDSNNYDKYSENNNVSECIGNVIMISGCMDSQTSAEDIINNNPQGAMSWSFIESINTVPNLSWRELIKSMRKLLLSKSYNQLPQLSTDSFYNIDSKLFI